MHFATVFFHFDNTVHICNIKELVRPEGMRVINPTIGLQVMKQYEILREDGEGTEVRPFNGVIIFEDQCKCL